MEASLALGSPKKKKGKRSGRRVSPASSYDGKFDPHYLHLLSDQLLYIFKFLVHYVLFHFLFSLYEMRIKMARKTYTR